MAVVTSDFLVGLRTQFRALFNREFSAAMTAQGWRQLSMMQTSDGELNSYEGFGTVPRMENVTHGPVSLGGLETKDFTVVNADYQAAFEVSRKAIERDRLNLIPPKVQQLALEAARHPSELIFNLVKDNANAYDGASFFGDTRVIGDSANIDNNVPGTGTTIVQLQTDLESAIGTMQLFQDDRGRPMMLTPNVIMVPTNLEQKFWRVLNGYSAQSDQPQVPPAGTLGGLWRARGYAAIANPYLTDPNDWYAFHVGGPAMRPFMYQEEKRPVLESDTNPNTRENIIARQFLYSVYGRYAVALTDPRLGVKITNI